METRTDAVPGRGRVAAIAALQAVKLQREREMAGPAKAFGG
jgi:hypothetical protein